MPQLVRVLCCRYILAMSALIVLLAPPATNASEPILLLRLSNIAVSITFAIISDLAILLKYQAIYSPAILRAFLFLQHLGTVSTFFPVYSMGSI
jgi:hypothetical protein